MARQEDKKSLFERVTGTNSRTPAPDNAEGHGVVEHTPQERAKEMLRGYYPRLKGQFSVPDYEPMVAKITKAITKAISKTAAERDRLKEKVEQLEETITAQLTVVKDGHRLEEINKTLVRTAQEFLDAAIAHDALPLVGDDEAIVKVDEEPTKSSLARITKADCELRAALKGEG